VLAYRPFHRTYPGGGRVDLSMPDLLEGDAVTDTLTIDVQDVPFPAAGLTAPAETADERETFTGLTREAVSDPDAERAFLAAKAHLIRTHPTLRSADRSAVLAELPDAVGHALPEVRATGGPVPGGVGYGVFYEPAFKSGFAQGTSLYLDIACPTQPGGNVNTWLYLTAMNRAGRGIEAFVAYFAQDQPRFKVFDWARPEAEHWQIDLAWSSLGSYLGTVSAHGQSFQTIGVWNSTFQLTADQWRNEALLLNRAANRWDLIYRYDYAATQAEQTGGFTGSWGPIVETFQDSYDNTNPVGALNTMLISRNSVGTWGSWALLGPTQSYIRTDNKGFDLSFLDPNYAFVVTS
jgi:hypothetical protein